jgi:hypothetical protein
MAKEVLNSSRDYISEPPEELTTYLGIAMSPDGPMLGIAACYCGDLADGEEALRPLGSFGLSISNTLGKMTYLGKGDGGRGVARVDEQFLACDASRLPRARCT